MMNIFTDMVRSPGQILMGKIQNSAEQNMCYFLYKKWRDKNIYILSLCTYFAPCLKCRGE